MVVLKPNTLVCQTEERYKIKVLLYKATIKLHLDNSLDQKQDQQVYNFSWI